MIRYRDSRIGGYNNRNVSEASRIPTVQVLKSFGTIDSFGVNPSGSTSVGGPTEVEFSLNVFRTGKVYQGEIYLVNYDTREKVNSNNLTYYEQSNDAEIICIFKVSSENNNCGYNLIVAVSPSNCTARSNGILYAYVPPIYNQGLNVGGPLKSGEVTICQCNCCEYDSGECTYYDTSNSSNSCCSNYNSSAATSTTTVNTANTANTTNTTNTTNNNTAAASTTTNGGYNTTANGRYNTSTNDG